jgi:hypothetical protein
MMIDRLYCDIIGNMNEYVGYKLERNIEEGWIKFTPPVLLQSYTDEFQLPEGITPSTPADDGQFLVPCKPIGGIKEAAQSLYRTGVGKLLHMKRWS